MITVSAVGFREVQPLSELGRDFTMVLLAAGIMSRGGPRGEPEDSGAIRMASMLLRPEVVSFLDMVTR